MKRPLIVGNWKMNGTSAEAVKLTRHVRDGVKALRSVEIALAPPFTALNAVASITGGRRIHLVAQNVHWEDKGAFTGEISARMLKEIGCQLVIVGHSERRHLFHETDRWVAWKIRATLNSGLLPILCVGETLAERQRGRARQVITRQLRAALKGIRESAIDKLTVAYEPVWAIGTGQHATPVQVAQAHRWIRDALKELLGRFKTGEIRILYGGSVRPDNSSEIAGVAEVDGLLIGGASLKADDFLRIIGDFEQSKSRQRRRK